MSLYSGVAGMSILFADRQAASLERSADRVTACGEALAAALRSERAGTGIGLYSGWPGVAFALERCADVTGRADWARLAGSFAEERCVDSGLRRVVHGVLDVMDGVSGLGLYLLWVHARDQSDWSAACATEVGDALLDVATTDEGLLWWPRVIDAGQTRRESGRGCDGQWSRAWRPDHNAECTGSSDRNHLVSIGLLQSRGRRVTVRISLTIATAWVTALEIDIDVVGASGAIMRLRPSLRVKRSEEAGRSRIESDVPIDVPRAAHSAALYLRAGALARASAEDIVYEIVDGDGDNESGRTEEVEAPQFYPNFAHGTAGTAYFLARLFQETGCHRFREAALSGAEWLRRSARSDETGAMAWRHDDAAGREVYYSGWCHGPVGTSRLFRVLRTISGDSTWEAVADGALRWVALRGVQPRRMTGLWNVAMCCGVAGVGNYCLDCHVEGAGDESLETARDAVRCLLRWAKWDGSMARWPQAEYRLKPNHIAAQSGYGQGAAGIACFLLRVALGEAKGWRTVLPDDPLCGTNS